MRKALQPKPTSRNPAQRAQRLAMLRNGWVAIPCEGKNRIIEDWPRIVVDAAQIDRWDGYGKGGCKFAGTGIRIEAPLFVLDLDIKDQEIMNAVLAAIEEAYPQFYAGSLWRDSGAVSLALFSRISEPVAGRHSITFTRLGQAGSIAEGGPVSEKAHIETYGGGTNGKYFAAYGPHAVKGREYGWQGPSPVDRAVSALPVFPADQVGPLHDMIEKVLGQFMEPMRPARDLGGMKNLYDLSDGMPFILVDGRTITLVRLEAELEIGTENGIRGTLSEQDYQESDSKARCHAFRRERNGRLMITDFYRDVNHYYEDEAPAPDVDHEAIAEAMRGIDETEIEDGANDNTEDSPLPPEDGNVQRRSVLRHADLIGHSPSGKFIYRPTGELWPSVTVDKRLPKVRLDAKGEDGKAIKLPASTFIMKTAVVEQMNWVPDEGEIIEDHVMRDAGRVFKKGARVYNLYRPAIIVAGDRQQASRWVDHVYMVYGDDDACHIIEYLGHAVQFPGIKINHALLMGGAQGIGKDTILVPLRTALGDWNIAEVRPPDLFEKFNRWQRAVVMRVNEMHDLGDESMYSLYERMKPLTTAPPEALKVNEKYLGEYYIPNVVKVIMTTNYKENGIYLPADDRRHYVAWSELLPNQPGEAYFNALHDWLDNGGSVHVAAYLRQLDLTSFNPKAPPLKTPAFWAIVNANRSSTDIGIGDVLEGMKDAGGGLPPILTISDLRAWALQLHLHEAYDWLSDIRHRRQIPGNLEKHGYVEVPNPTAKDRRWLLEGRKQSIYRINTLSLHEAVKRIDSRIAQSVREK